MGHDCRDCRGVSRRRMLGLGLGGFLGFAAARQTEALGLPRLDFLLPQDGTRAPAKACIVVWLAGGPSQLETFDPKEGRDTGGPTKAIETSVPGVRISEHLPTVAKVLDKMTIVRSVTSKEGSHERGRYLLHTGYLPGPLVHPSFGSIVAMELGRKDFDLPNFISVGAPSEGAGFLPSEYSPFFVDKPGDSIRNLSYGPGVTQERFRARMELLNEQEKEFAKEHASEETERHKIAYAKADKLMHTPLRKAFDELTQEKEELRKAYGDNAFGKGCLLARRLVEVGVKIVEVNLGGWDTHEDNFTRVGERCRILDGGLGTLIRDLRDRRLLDSTLVVCMGEFGRTPRINQRNGRDHYPKAWSLALAGGGIQGGRVWGETDRDGLEVAKDPVTIPDLFATLYSCLGVDYAKKLPTPLGNRYVYVDNGKPIKGLIS